eukprot:Tbor_TRINITY_DN7458_c0_g1::TRINITY_DN7458_c0_g1_i1::g.14608::m.14608
MADVSLAASTNRSNATSVPNRDHILHAIDTQRVVAVLEKAVERLELLRMMNYETATESVTFGSTVSPATGSSKSVTLDGNKTTQGRGVGDILNDQKRLEKRYEDLLKVVHVPRPNPLGPVLDPTCYAHVEDLERKGHIHELHSISRQLKEQSKILCHQLKENPNDTNNWHKVVTERDELIKLLMGSITELQTSAQSSIEAASRNSNPPVFGKAASTTSTHVTATYESFARKVVDEQSASNWANALVKKEKETNQNVKQLQNEVKQERALKEQELEQCHAQLSQLKLELRQLRKDIKSRAEKMRDETESSREALERKANEEQRILNNIIYDTLNSDEVEIKANQDMEGHLVKKTKELDEKTQKWNEHIEREQRKLEEAKHDVERNRQDYADKLRNRSDQLVAAERNKKERDEERSMVEEAKRDKEAHAHARYCAATKLQAALKGMFTRELLVSIKKKAAKKKKPVAQ